MRFNYLCLFCAFSALMILSCDTYRTYYGETSSDIVATSGVNILRLDLSQSDRSVSGISKLHSLRVLNLSSRVDLDLNTVFNSVPNPEELRVLILDSLNLKVVPEAISRFTNLTHLSLNYNIELDVEGSIEIISEIPLEFLNFQNNNLEIIPRSIEKLYHLVDFNLSHNELRNFDHYDFLSSLVNLKSLWLTGNNLEVFPSSLTSLSQIRNLYIEDNELVIIPDAIVGMKNVWVIHAGNNLFEELPINFGKMPNLVLLHINNCRISKIPKFYSGKKKHYSILGLVIDNNLISEKDKLLYKKKFGHFFILSF